MLKEKRFEVILGSLQTKDMVTYEEMASELNVSNDTVRRDIEHLHNSGLLSKVRGGAIPRAMNPLSFQDRQSYLRKEKDTIALKAQQLIKSGMTIFMDGGTTMCAIASLFPRDIILTVVTNNYALIDILATYKNVYVIVLGGNYNRHLQIFYGTQTCTAADNFNVELYFMGTCGLDAKFGVSTIYQEDAQVKRVMLRSARTVVALANRDSLRKMSTYKICDPGGIDVLITDLNSDHHALNDYREWGIQIL
ncbi:DeoR/GlpR family DNA-binding transcription regulator [Chitinophaga horti]|uniref:DeoR/GlpR family DNA-binding transcription regulator n=1 Tax=Chitinophaga horti TaxID=2920382 RepID=A0ABY6J5H7_9BACT|nr:DeoR/GlpR family DNA-binding transcription regulator [Chitinophaga horti]UYQ94938.1 DeoR/GlpR family DNA-binding transcription regulator [Chitinophaga horti]